MIFIKHRWLKYLTYLLTYTLFIHLFVEINSITYLVKTTLFFKEQSKETLSMISFTAAIMHYMLSSPVKQWVYTSLDLPPTIHVLYIGLFLSTFHNLAFALPCFCSSIALSLCFHFLCTILFFSFSEHLRTSDMATMDSSSSYLSSISE